MSDSGHGFCANCGTPRRDGMRFCSKCGAPIGDLAPAQPPAAAPAPVQPQAAAPASVQPPAAAPAPAPASGGEQVLAIIPNASLKKGFMGLGRTNYTVVLTDLRIAFAQITPEMLKQAVADARDDAKSAGKGFFGQWGAQLGAYSALSQRYVAMPVDQALAENQGNFALDRRAVQKVKLRRGSSGTEDVPDSPDRLIIKTTDDKYTLELGTGLGVAKDALNRAGLL